MSANNACVPGEQHGLGRGCTEVAEKRPKGARWGLEGRGHASDERDRWGAGGPSWHLCAQPQPPPTVQSLVHCRGTGCGRVEWPCAALTQSREAGKPPGGDRPTVRPAEQAGRRLEKVLDAGGREGARGVLPAVPRVPVVGGLHGTRRRDSARWPAATRNGLMVARVCPEGEGLALPASVHLPA